MRERPLALADLVVVAAIPQHLELLAQQDKVIRVAMHILLTHITEMAEAEVLVLQVEMLV
jgi:hypothetical protein